MRKRAVVIFLLLAVFIGLISGCSVNVRHLNDLEDVSINGYFSSNMVLQRERQVAIFGKGTDGVEVTVTFDGQEKKTTVENGKWLLHLDEMEACSEGKDLTVTANGKSRVLENVVVGDVWLCSGQSNMEWMTSWFSKETQEEIQSRGRNDMIRSCYVTPRKSNGVMDDIEDIKWVVSDSNNCLTMSCYAICFAQSLQPALDIPVGILTVAVGSTELDKWLEGGTYYNSEIAPLMPFTFKGVVWYQGESDLYHDPDSIVNYPVNFGKLLDIFREDCNNPDCPVLVAQLANYNAQATSGTWADFRGMQAELQHIYDNVYVVCGLDYSPVPSASIQIHPDVKIRQGDRTAKLALECVYGYEGVYGSAAYLDKVELLDDDHLLLTFANVHNKLEGFRSSKARMLYICGEDGVFVTTTGEFQNNNQILVDISAVENFKTIKYCWVAVASPTIKSEGIPVFSFNYTMPAE